MSDLIDRHAAIDALHMHLMYRMGTVNNKKRLDDWINGLPSAQPDERMLHESCTDCPLYDKDRHSCPRFNKVIPVTLRELQSAQPEQRWIPCSERLPEGITQVIIQTNGEAIHEAIYMGKDDYGHYVWKRPDNEIYWDEEVVAWMPLPEPYKTESEDKE